MSAWLIGTVSVIYLGASITLAYEGKPGLALFCIGCVIANVGLLMTARG